MKITLDLKNKISSLADKHSLHLVVLYGSRVKGLARENSDTDIAVKSNKLLSNSEILKLEAEFGTFFPLAEIVDIRTAPVLLLANIARTGVLLFQYEERTFTEFKIQAINQYIEYKPQLELRSKKIKEELKKY